MTTLEDGLEFPPELCEGPQALVGVAGLDTLNNAIHRIVWEALANSQRQDRSAVHFKLLGPVHEFPPMKPKRNSYEWYIPKGIIKRNWMKKHLKEVPAVVVIFYDLDWDDSEWPEKKIECTSRVQSIRAALEGRNTRLGVVLIQQKPPLPAAEDILAVDRAAALCSACDISHKCLFILPHVDHLQGYVLRLENAFYEMALGYYQQEIRNIKSHREFLNKTTHQYLFVRHQYKMAFLSELKQDNRNAHVHYSASYSNLLELRINDTNSLEVKTVAGYILYKVCRLLFALNQPRDAINQFRSHVDHFRTRIGPPELTFQHHAWLAKQYCLFGELFEEAIRGGLPAVQTMHPGYYYEQAAKHTVDRKVAAAQLCQAIIISLLGNAITQFKTYRCPRMRRHLAIQMADEYYSSKDYGKALTLLTHMLWDYRAEGWVGLLISLITKALSCAFITASVREYVDLSLEASTLLPPDRQLTIFDNIMALVKGEVPNTEPGVEESEVTSARILWSSKMSSVLPPHIVDMSNISPCVDCKAQLVQETFTSVEIRVLIRSRISKEVKFSRLSVCVNNPAVSSEFSMCDSDSEQLIFQPGEVKSFLCQFNPDPTDAGKEIQIGSILLELGSDKGQKIVLRFTGNDTNKYSQPELSHFRYTSPEDTQYERLVPRTSLVLAQPTALLQLGVTHSAPALQGSWHRLTVDLTNPEAGPITQASLHVAIKPTPEDLTIEQKTDMCEGVGGGLLSLPLTLAIGDIPAGSSVTKLFHMQPHTLTTRYFNIFVKYTSSKGEHCAQIVEETVYVKKALEVKFSFLSTQFEPITKLYAREPFYILPQIDCLAPCPVTIMKTDLQLASEVDLQQKTYECPLAGQVLSEGEGGTCIACLVLNTPSDQPISLGNLVISWNREGGETSSLLVALPSVTLASCPLGLEASLPAHGWVRTPLTVSYLIHNHTQSLISLNLNMEPSEAFMFAGHKQMKVSVLPQSHHKMEYNLYSLVSGLVALPQLKLTVSPEVATAQQVSDLIERTLPSHVYIME